MKKLSTNPKIGLVTVLYNGKEVLPDFFESLANQTFKNYVLYVIDNSPNDDALNLAMELAARYDIESEFINNNANLGVAKGNNQGIELAIASGCEFVLLLNNDIDFNNNVIEEMLNYAVKHNESIIVPKIYFAGTNRIWQAGGGVSCLTGIGYHVGEGLEDVGQFNAIQHYENSSTCFALIRKDVIDNVGFMDEDYFVYYDDTDFFYRCNNLGFKVLYLPTVFVNHKVGFSSGGEESDFSLRYGSRNLILFYRKNMGLVKLFYYSSFLVMRVVISNILKMKGYKKFKVAMSGLKEGFLLNVNKR